MLDYILRSIFPNCWKVRMFYTNSETNQSKEDLILLQNFFKKFIVEIMHSSFWWVDSTEYEQRLCELIPILIIEPTLGFVLRCVHKMNDTELRWKTLKVLLDIPMANSVLSKEQTISYIRIVSNYLVTHYKDCDASDTKRYCCKTILHAIETQMKDDARWVMSIDMKMEDDARWVSIDKIL